VEQKSAADLFAPELVRYRARLRRQRRVRYLGWAALAVSVVWLALALLNLFNFASPNLILAGIGLTLAIPGAALLYEAARPADMAATASSLDGLLDNRQRMITSVELLAAGSDKPITEAQLASSATILQSTDPRTIYPARVPTTQALVAGGLLLLALGLFLLKEIHDSAPQAGGLPPSQSMVQAVPTSTPQSGLPDAAQQPARQTPQPQQQQSSQTPGASSTGGDQSTAGLSPGQAAQQAADSRTAQKALQRLAQALDQQSVTQGAADALRQGDYTTAANDLTNLGKNNDQLSDQAKQSLANALQSAAQDSPNTPDLQNAEQNAANALNQGDYAVTSDALKALAQAIQDTGSAVVPQQDLSKNFPDQNGQQSQQAQQGQSGQQGQQDQSGQQGQGQQDQSGQSGQRGQQGQNGQQGDNGQQGQNGQNGQNGQPGQNGQSGVGDSSQGNQGGVGGQPNQQGQQSPQNQGPNQSGDPNSLQGEGSQVQGPGAQALNVPGNPFVLDGNPDPNGNQTANQAYPNAPPALTLNGGAGGSTSPGAPARGAAVTANGETNSPPADRWGIVQKYFSGGGSGQQSNQSGP
jgi:hypothetical protein